MARKYQSLSELAKMLVDRLVSLGQGRSSPLVVALDGPDCSGKTILSREIVTQGKAQAHIVLVHFDDYLNEKSIRLRKGEFSEVGFREDYFDYIAFADGILKPARRLQQDPSSPRPRLVLVEGLFLLDKRIRPYLDCAIRLEVSEELIIRRALARDIGVIGDEMWVRQHYQEQCIPAQRAYREETRPSEFAIVTAVACDDGQYAVDS